MTTIAKSIIKGCTICRRDYDEYGHEAWPINGGRCCNYCNDTVVIPARIRLAKKERERAGGQ